jgi:hypothetical protein
MSDLRDELTDISGIGDATADKILDVLQDHGTSGDDSRLLEKARAAAERGDDHKAGVWLRRWDA